MKISNRLSKSTTLRHIRRTLKQFTLRDIRPIGKTPFIIRWWDVLRLRFTIPKKETALILNKHSLITSDPYWFLQNFKEIFEDEIYFFEIEQTTPVIVDCGSNIGLSILYFKQLFPTAKITGYEPDPYLYEILKKNLAVYDYQDVELIQKAVWKEEGTLNFHQDRSLGGSLISKESVLFHIEVPTIRLKDKLGQHVDLLKIDIEGAEYEVLSDCADNLPNVENIFVEYHGSAKNRQQFRHLMEILEETGFRYYIKEALPVDHPFVRSERKGGYDLQYNIFAFRNF